MLVRVQHPVPINGGHVRAARAFMKPGPTTKHCVSLTEKIGARLQNGFIGWQNSYDTPYMSLNWLIRINSSLRVIELVVYFRWLERCGVILQLAGWERMEGSMLCLYPSATENKWSREQPSKLFPLFAAEYHPYCSINGIAYENQSGYDLIEKVKVHWCLYKSRGFVFVENGFLTTVHTCL